jgi:hypothetical protein
MIWVQFFVLGFYCVLILSWFILAKNGPVICFSFVLHFGLDLNFDSCFILGFIFVPFF